MKRLTTMMACALTIGLVGAPIGVYADHHGDAEGAAAEGMEEAAAEGTEEAAAEGTEEAAAEGTEEAAAEGTEEAAAEGTEEAAAEAPEGGEDMDKEHEGSH